MHEFIGSGHHWRVLRAGRDHGLDLWQVYRRHWDHWETVGAPWLSRNGAMTYAHDLARLNHA